jgi:hypothetical protein
VCVRERELWKEKCAQKDPFLEVLWCDGNSRTLHGYGPVKQRVFFEPKVSPSIVQCRMSHIELVINTPVDVHEEEPEV